MTEKEGRCKEGTQVKDELSFIALLSKLNSFGFAGQQIGRHD